MLVSYHSSQKQTRTVFNIRLAKIVFKKWGQSGQESNRSGMWRQELMERTWRGAVTGLLLIAC